MPSCRTRRRGPGMWPARGPCSPKRRNNCRGTRSRLRRSGCRRRKAAPCGGERIVLDPALAPLANLGDEAEIAHELVVDEVVPAVDWPEEIRPLAVDLVRKTF